MTKHLGEMTEDEFQRYVIEAHAHAENKARNDLQRMIDRGDWPPRIYTENGVSYMRRTVPLERRSKREPVRIPYKLPRHNRWAEFKEWLFRYE